MYLRLKTNAHNLLTVVGIVSFRRVRQLQSMGDDSSYVLIPNDWKLPWKVRNNAQR